ncbi:aldo/keto reductase [Paludibaculum fermentans]|uniref:Aldo/keto reductase n=1 Tax=Paludibaculum fermentans TaxID=1473598 RepID=A0A7S7NTT1_PALFE|nr:aldo/keto reductase [Paludibaculum fermentans]QOY89687.1 aldo/keto reductase [Paludibaculum fermentans]
MKRRSFLTAGAGAVSLSAFPYHLFAGTTQKLASDVVTLGPRKIKLSRLAMGTGTNGAGGSSNQTKKLGLEGVAYMMRAAVDNGVNFWDSADQYGTHAHLKEALKKTPREKVVIMSKTHASTETEMKADIDRFRREIGTDYIDILLLHCMMDADWPQRKKGAMEYINELQERGIVRTKGVSCHTMGALKASAASPWVEVDLARLNPAGVAMDASPAEVIPVLKQMKASGKGIIGMKIFGAGKLRNKTDECLQYALSQDVLDCFTIGSENVNEMMELTKKIPASSTRG